MDNHLSKKEQIEQRHQEEKERTKKQKRFSKLKKWVILACLSLVVVGIGWLFVKDASKPLAGKDVEALGRDHVKIGTKVKYNSNPPTSGPHYAEWVKAGVYEKPQIDGMLVHSLEHGYVIISYNCRLQNSKFEIRNSKLGTESALLNDFWNTKSCKDLKKNLSDLANEQRLWKLIVVPRPNLDAKVALTAWTRIDKMDKIDKDEIVAFIQAFRDNGPEKTME